MKRNQIILIVALMIIAFSLAFVISLSISSSNNNLAGQAYAYNSNCHYCLEYCGSTFPNSAGRIAMADHIKTLGEGCQGETIWSNQNQDIVLCCK